MSRVLAIAIAAVLACGTAEGKLVAVVTQTQMVL